MKLLKRKDDTKIVVGPVRLTYCYIGIPYEDGDSLNYKTGILIPKEETEAVKTIQAAIERAPEKPSKPYKILIKKGRYQEKVIIDRPNIVLVGEQRDSTMIQIAELMIFIVQVEAKCI